MVHALTEAHRVLRRTGHLVDLHPERGPRRPRRLPVYIVVDGRATPAGEWPEEVADYDRFRASDEAVRRVVRRGFFTVRQSATFLLRYYFRSLSALDAMLEKEWTTWSVPPSLRSRVKDLLDAQPDAWIAVVEPFRLNVLEKA